MHSGVQMRLMSFKQRK